MGGQGGQMSLEILRRRIEEITEAIPRSLEADRADYASVSVILRPLVILRGLCTRAILRNQRARCRRELETYYGQPAAPSDEPPAIPAGRLAAEATLFGRALRDQLRDRLFPRLPALVGLVAGWWVANTYTDSHWKSALRSVGIGGGGTHVVSGETYRLLVIGLPILSAAVCAYLGNRLAQFIRHRYSPADGTPKPGDTTTG